MFSCQLIYIVSRFFILQNLHTPHNMKDFLSQLLKSPRVGLAKAGAGFCFLMLLMQCTVLILRAILVILTYFIMVKIKLTILGNSESILSQKKSRSRNRRDFKSRRRNRRDFKSRSQNRQDFKSRSRNRRDFKSRSRNRRDFKSLGADLKK